jgi:hypothetical protein
MPGGRPTHYRSEYCERAVELGAQGKSLAQIGAACGVARVTLWEWAEKHPEFGKAIARARDLALAWWEEQAHIGMWESPEGARLNPQLWSRSMAARFPDDYRESKKTEISGPDGGPVKTQVVVSTGVPQAPLEADDLV